jgi:hypothetical protein
MFETLKLDKRVVPLSIEIVVPLSIEIVVPLFIEILVPLSIEIVVPLSIEIVVPLYIEIHNIYFPNILFAVSLYLIIKYSFIVDINLRIQNMHLLCT